jgi:hypothetical protein
MQLNQDPTSVDSWTFNINSSRTTFYQAFTETGANSANGSPGLVDLNPHLGSLGFEKNGNRRLCFQDTAELGQDSNYINQDSFPNSGLMVHGKYTMWLSMFGRHIQAFDDELG